MKLKDIFFKSKPLFESPQMVHSAGVDLENPEQNRKLARQLKADHRKSALKSVNDYTLYEIGHKYALVHNTKDVVAYFLQYELQFFKFLNRQCASQVFVWADPTIIESQGVARTIFWDNLLYKTQTIITDYGQTQEGKRFWGNRMADALSRNDTYIYFVSLQPNRKIVPITSVEQIQRLRLDGEAWGDDVKHTAQRVIVTTKPFPKEDLTSFQ